MARLSRMMRGLGVADTWKNIPACDVIVACADVHRSISDGRRCYAPISDSILDELVSAGWKCASMAYYDSLLVGKSAHASPASVNRLFFWARIRDRLRSAFRRVKTPHEREVRASTVRAYGKIFDRAGCRAVIAVGSPLEMYHAARPRGIKVIEVMHGIGYPSIPWGWDNLDAQDLPDAILSLDPVTTQTMSPLQSRGIAIRQIVHPFVSRVPSLSPEGRQRISSSGKKTVLVSLQWGYDGEQATFNGILPNGIMPDGLVAAIRETEDTVFWMLRLHPIQLRHPRYKRHRDYVADLVRTTTNCEWVQASNKPLTEVLAGVDAHVTMCSMTAYEAAYSGVPSLLLCPLLRPGAENERYFADLIEAGFATRGEASANAIKAWVAAAHRREDYPLPTGESVGSVIRELVGPPGRGARR